MRIACVHIPQFALQCATRIDPGLRAPGAPGAPESDGAVGAEPAALVVVGPPAPAAGANAVAKPAAPIVLACSRAAWALGARVGMSAAAARNLSPLIHLVTADPQLERDTVRAVADALLALTPVVDVGGRVGPGNAHLALYCEVPPRTRGTSFGDRLLERLEALGLTGRIGIADDRFTAWVAAWLGAADSHDRRAPSSSHAAGATASATPAAATPTIATDAPARHDESGVVSVPRGGSAAFLAPRPLSLLSISPEVQHMLESLGVRTLGEFAALPAPTVSSRAARFEADYQALARGESGTNLRPYAPDAPIREDALLHGISAPAAVALLADRVAMRLAGRARSAARLDITIGGDEGERLVTVAPVRDGRGVLGSAEEIAEAIGAALGDSSVGGHLWRLRVVVAGEALAGDARFTDDAAPVPASFSADAAADTQRSFALSVAPSAAVAPSSASPAASSFAAAASRRGPSSATSQAGVPNPPISDADVALSIALSTTGSTVDRVFGLTAPVSSTFASERRDSHRRTRRGKQRRRAEVASIVQPRLFKI